MTPCPPDCAQDRKRFRNDIRDLFKRSIPTWVRTLLVAGLLLLFGLYASYWAYASSTYVTRTELKETLMRVEQTNDAVMGRIERKVDKLLERP